MKFSSVNKLKIIGISVNHLKTGRLLFNARELNASGWKETWPEWTMVPELSKVKDFSLRVGSNPTVFANKLCSRGRTRINDLPNHNRT